MKYDPLFRPVAERTVEQPSLAEKWLSLFSQKKVGFLATSFGDAMMDEKAVANTAFRIAYGLSHDPEAYGALIEWAHDPSKKPDQSDVEYFVSQGYVELDASRPKDMVYHALGINPPVVEHQNTIGIRFAAE